MKIEKIVKKQSIFLKLKLIKTKMYAKTKSFSHLRIEDVECRLKKGLQVIFRYHVSGKKILFVGNSSFAEEAKIKKLLKNTRHAFVPEYLWSHGYIFNSTVYPTYTSKCKLFHETSILKSKSHLVVVLNGLAIDIRIENYRAKIPTIALSDNLNIFDVTFGYKILGNLVISKKKEKSHLFLMLLQSFLRQQSVQTLVLNKKHKIFHNRPKK